MNLRYAAESKVCKLQIINDPIIHHFSGNFKRTIGGGDRSCYLIPQMHAQIFKGGG